MRVAVIGGGIFGCTTAVELAAEHTVDLYERRPDLLLGASRANQGRLHHGYHYPRSPHADRMAAHARRFAIRFPEALAPAGRRYYCVAADGSLTGGEEYLEFCRRAFLPFHRHMPSVVRRDAVGLCVRVPEVGVDVAALRGVLRRDLREARVRVHVDTQVEPLDLDHDLVVQATYGQPVAQSIGTPAARPLAFEVCEVALVRLGRHLSGMSFVVMDGPFVSLDPVPGRDVHMLYDVANSVHAANVGHAPEVPEHLAPLLDRGRVHTRHSRVEEMTATARRFLRGFGMPEYCGSMFTVRAVLPDVDATDERPTLVERDGRLITILPGKIATAPWAAERVADLARVGDLQPDVFREAVRAA